MKIATIVAILVGVAVGRPNGQYRPGGFTQAAPAPIPAPGSTPYTAAPASYAYSPVSYATAPAPAATAFAPAPASYAYSPVSYATAPAPAATAFAPAPASYAASAPAFSRPSQPHTYAYAVPVPLSYPTPTTSYGTPALTYGAPGGEVVHEQHVQLPAGRDTEGQTLLPESSITLPTGSRVDIRDEHQQYSHGYKDTAGTEVSEQGRLITTNGGWEAVIAKEGSYSYTSPEGIPITVKYIADEKGFRVIS